MSKLVEGVPVRVRIDNGDGTFDDVWMTPGPTITVDMPGVATKDLADKLTARESAARRPK